jgi:hypothetical protein
MRKYEKISILEYIELLQIIKQEIQRMNEKEHHMLLQIHLYNLNSHQNLITL